jgi:hypothetical protein
MKPAVVLAIAAILAAACAPRDPGPILYEVAPQGQAVIT